MRVLVVDNYDSFAYDLVRCLGERGTEIIARRSDEVSTGVSGLHPDRIVVSPGSCTPEEATISLEVAGDALEIVLTQSCLGG